MVMQAFRGWKMDDSGMAGLNNFPQYMEASICCLYTNTFIFLPSIFCQCLHCLFIVIMNFSSDVKS